MANKDITQLAEALDFKQNDILIVRKIIEQEDKAISYQNMKKSLGDSNINGFFATKYADNKLKLTCPNGNKIVNYVEKMYICFVSPITSNANQMLVVKIDDLGEKNLILASSQILQNEFIEAVLINGDFKQVNFSNNTISADHLVDHFTDNVIYLSPAYGAAESQRVFYQNETINFRAPQDFANDTLSISRNNVTLPLKYNYQRDDVKKISEGTLVKLMIDLANNMALFDTFMISDPRLLWSFYTANNQVQINGKEVTIDVTANNFKQIWDQVLITYGYDGQKTGEQVNVILNIKEDLLLKATVLTLYGQTKKISAPVLGMYYITVDFSWITLKSPNKTIKATFLSEKNVDLKNPDQKTKFLSLLGSLGNGSKPFSIEKGATLSVTVNPEDADNNSAFFTMHYGVFIFNDVTFMASGINTIFSTCTILSLTNCQLLNDNEYMTEINSFIVLNNNYQGSNLLLNKCIFNITTKSTIICANSNINCSIDTCYIPPAEHNIFIDDSIYNNITIYVKNSWIPSGSNKDPNTQTSRYSYWVNGNWGE